MKPWVKDLRNAPKQYQQGWTEFYKLKFNLTPDVLIPRPESELLVDEVLALCHPRPDRGSKNDSVDSRLRGNDMGGGNDNIVVLDVGTGSGAIAIAIAKNAPNIKILASDISQKALDVAESNAKKHKVHDRMFFVLSDLLEGIQAIPDIVVTNLPYIPTARLKYIDPMVTEFEPRVALDGGEDGFELYRKLFQQLALHLKGVKLNHPEGVKLKYLFGEIDYTHGELAIQEALNYFPNAEVDVKKDLTHMQRILSIKF